MKRLILIFTVLLASCLALPAQAQEAEAQPASHLSRDSILIGDQVRWSIPLRIAPGEEFWFEHPDDPVAEGVVTVEEFAVDTLKQRRNYLDVEGHMLLTAFDAGTYFLPPLVAMIQRTDGSVDTLYYEAPALEVATIPIDTATFKPYDIKGQIRYPLTFSEVAPWVVGGLLLAALIVLLVRWLNYRYRNRSLFGKKREKEAPHIVALRSLERIRGKKLCQNNHQKQFYSEVTETLRQYMADFYEVPALEQTTTEIFDSLRAKKIEKRLLDEVKNLFELADFVKFAKHNATEEENDAAIPTAVRFINTTYQQRLEEEQARAQAEQQKKMEDE